MSMIFAAPVSDSIARWYVSMARDALTVFLPKIKTIDCVNQHISVLQISGQYSIVLRMRFESNDCCNLSKCYGTPF